MTLLNLQSEKTKATSKMNLLAVVICCNTIVNRLAIGSKRELCVMEEVSWLQDKNPTKNSEVRHMKLIIITEERQTLVTRGRINRGNYFI